MRRESEAALISKTPSPSCAWAAAGWLAGWREIFHSTWNQHLLGSEEQELLLKPSPIFLAVAEINEAH
jgi:hypothetical protein